MKLSRLLFCVLLFPLASQPLVARNHHNQFRRIFKQLPSRMMRNFCNNIKFLGIPSYFFLTPFEPNNSNAIEVTFVRNDTYNSPDASNISHNILPLFGEEQTKNKYDSSGGRKRYEQYNPNNTKKKITFNDVKGQSEAIKEVSEVVDFLKYPAKYQKLGAEIPKGILLEGPPGCGKTLLARAVAGEAGCAFIHACGSHFINKYVGAGADNIRKLFEQARSQAPSIIFIDEIDAIGARKRGTNKEYHHTINALLDQMDGFKKDDNVIVIAATNFAKSLDPALVRPGRFDRIINVGFPTRKGREAIINLYANKILLDPSISINELSKEFAQRTTAFSGAELKKLTNEAALTACRHKSPNVTIKHFEEAYDKITLGLANNLDRTPEQLRRTSCHESGHTLIKLLTKQPIAKVSILSKGDALGVTFEKEKYENTSEYQKEELFSRIMALQGGYLAEKIFLNCSRPGASADIKQAYRIARAMVKEFGMGKGELEGLRYSNDMSQPWKAKFDQEISDILRDCSKKTEKLLHDNQDKLNALTEALLKKETLNEAEILEVAAIS